MTIPTLPTPPTRSQDQTTFDTNIAAWIAALDAWTTAVNAMGITTLTGSIQSTPIGNVTPSTGAFTTLSATLGQVVQGITIGKGAGTIATNTAIGNIALSSNTTGSYNTCLGYQAGANITTGAQNECFGSIIMDQGTGVTGDGNLAVGRGIARPLTSGGNNTFLGNDSGNGITTGSSNTLVGNMAAATLTTGSSNTIIGQGTVVSAIGVSSELVIGAGLNGKGTQTAFIGGTSGAYNGANVTTWATTSDKRIKENITSVENGLATILALNPVAFQYIETGKPDIGFIAQEYQIILPEQVISHTANEVEKALVGSDEILTIQQNLVPYLVKAIQELKTEFDDYKIRHP